MASAAPGWAGWTGMPGAQLRTRAQEAGVRVVLTVERFAWDRAGVKTTVALLSDPAAGPCSSVTSWTPLTSATVTA